MHKTENRIIITGSLEDKHYYERVVIPLFCEEFRVAPGLKKSKNKNSYYLRLENKTVFNAFLSLGLKRGNKINAKVPLSIMTDLNLIPHFLRGLFDTAGCLKFSKQARKYNYYPRIRFCLKIGPLFRNLGILLNKLNFNYCEFKDKRYDTAYYEISGKKNVDKWIKLIGMNNPVHKTKYLFWKKFGKHIPKFSLKQRLKSIGLNINNFG